MSYPSWPRVIGIVGGLGPHAHIRFEQVLLRAARILPVLDGSALGIDIIDPLEVGARAALSVAAGEREAEVDEAVGR